MRKGPDASASRAKLTINMSHSQCRDWGVARHASTTDDRIVPFTSIHVSRYEPVEKLTLKSRAIWPVTIDTGYKFN